MFARLAGRMSFQMGEINAALTVIDRLPPTDGPAAATCCANICDNNNKTFRLTDIKWTSFDATKMN